MSAETNPERGLHPCASCGLELDGDDSSDRCEECDALCAVCGRDNDNGTHQALEMGGHLSHSFIPGVDAAARVLARATAAVAQVAGCSNCEGTGLQVTRYSRDFEPTEFGPCSVCEPLARAALTAQGGTA